MSATTASTNPFSLRKQLNMMSALDRFSVIAVIISIVVASLVAFSGLVLAVRWYNTPFLGVLFYPNSTTFGGRSLIGTDWPGTAAGFLPGDRIMDIDGVSIPNTFDSAFITNAELEKKQFGQTITVIVERSTSRYNPATMPNCQQISNDRVTCTLSVLLTQYPLIDLLGLFGLGFVLALGAIALAMWLLYMYPNRPDARIAALIACWGSVLFIARFEISSTFYTGYPTRLLYLALGLLAGFQIQLSIYFPYPLRFVRNNQRNRTFVTVMPLLIAGVMILLDAIVFPGYPDISLIIMMSVGFICAVYMIGAMLWKRVRAASTLAREQATVVLLGVFIVMIFTGSWLFTNILESSFNVRGISFSTIFLQIPLFLFGFSLAYAVNLRRIIDADRIVNETAIITVLGIMLIAGYTAVAGALYALTAGVIRPENPILIGITLFIVAILFMPVRLRLERYIDEAFYRRRVEYDRRLETMARKIPTLVQTQNVVYAVQEEINAVLRPQNMHLFVINTSGDAYQDMIRDVEGKPKTDIRFLREGGLVRYLSGTDTVVNLDRVILSPLDLDTDRPRLNVLNAKLIASFRTGKGINGFITIGPRIDGVNYSHEECRYLEGLADQAAAAVERSQVIVEASRNEKELSVLVQVNDQLNETMEFDLMLEFLYAQVDKLIPAQNFFIVLFAPDSSRELFYALYQEYGERIAEKENQPFSISNDLISEVIKTQKAIRVDNYVREMQRRDSSHRIENQNFRAWIGVPLKAGDNNVMGCMVVCASDPTIIYTPDQVRTLGGIADQAGKALYKTRLYADKSRLASQMTLLNDTSATLGGLFEDFDKLLYRVTEAATQIANCEAASLFLLDDDTEELYFAEVIGGAGNTLKGQLVPKGRGVVWQVITDGEARLTNDITQESTWLGELPESSRRGFNTQSMITLPLVNRNRLIGALQVLNKRYSSRFTETDKETLIVFCAQAAIAIANARLFKQTDEALGDRVKQLQSMQRIDQELNRYLDISRVVDLAVDNAMREAHADVGMLVIIEGTDFLVVGCSGYPEDIIKAGDRIPLEWGILEESYRTGDVILDPPPQSAQSMRHRPFLQESQQMLCIPMLSGQDVTAIMLMETTHEEQFNHLLVDHLQVLADHANTALTNARLFNQLEKANASRTKLMAVVAHELNTPLTSIKGYTEFLLSGKLQAERQQDMLLTIRRNAALMEQLIRDLRDFTAQESGQLQLKLSLVSFNDIVLDAIRPQQRGFDSKNQTISVRLPEESPIVWADSDRVFQILSNFLSNANKYTPDGGQINVGAEVVNQEDPTGLKRMIHCWVTDNGIGLSEEDLQKLFTPYWRSENPEAQKQKGTGLGMSLTRGLVEAQNGKMWVESKLGAGSTFHFTIPLATEQQAPVAR
jgi:signal transduction histidine kinase/putative methionine-R-sulfoxide reductase with GAF domain